MESLNKFRAQEGKSIEKDFADHLGIIQDCLDKIIDLDKSRIAGIKDRIKGNLNEVIGADKIDNNRFEQELIYYIEKLDINEEKVRLKTHLDYFLTTMKEPSKRATCSYRWRNQTAVILEVTEFFGPLCPKP